MRNFNEKTFKVKVIETLEIVPFTHDVLALYFCLKDPKTPISIKVQIIGTLVYFISPIDAIPDTIPVVGYTDDAGVIMALLSTINSYITEEHYQQANEFLEKLKED